jgi:hypothetical protein
MAIDLAKLSQAGINSSSKNILLREIYYATQRSMGIIGGGGANPIRIRMLDDLMMAITAYLTSKPPSGTDKNNAKWNALRDVVQQISVELAAVGGKGLTTPADYRHIDARTQNYWLERADPSHRPGYALSDLYAEWVDLAGDVSFWEYAKGKKDGEHVRMLTPDERVTYEVYFDGGVFRNCLGEPASTMTRETHFSGLGWGIFVCSAKGDLFVATHKVGEFHHSTLLAGGSVAAAGEIVIDAGIIKMISSKTGHYRSGGPEMRRMLQLIPTIQDTALVMVQFAPSIIVYRVGDFRARGDGATMLWSHEVSAALPGWCKNGKSQTGFFGKLPQRPVQVAPVQPAPQPQAPAAYGHYQATPVGHYDPAPAGGGGASGHYDYVVAPSGF